MNRKEKGIIQEKSWGTYERNEYIRTHYKPGHWEGDKWVPGNGQKLAKMFFITRQALNKIKKRREETE